MLSCSASLNLFICSPLVCTTSFTSSQVSRARADLIHLRETRILAPAAGPCGSEIVHLLRPVQQSTLPAAAAAKATTEAVGRAAECSMKALVQVVCCRSLFTHPPALLLISFSATHLSLSVLIGTTMQCRQSFRVCPWWSLSKGSCCASSTGAWKIDFNVESTIQLLKSHHL